MLVPQKLALPRLPSPSPHAPLRSSAFVPGPASGARGEALQSKVGLIYCSLAQRWISKQRVLLLTASINHPAAVPLWARARRVSFAVAARQEDFPGSGRICFTFVACFWHLLLNQNPLDVVISKRFTAAACEVGGTGGQGTEISSTSLFQRSAEPLRAHGDGGGSPWEGMGGCPEREARAWDGLLPAKFTLLFLRQKLIVSASEGRGSCQRLCPSPRLAALAWLLGSLNPCPLPPLPTTSLPRIEPKHPGVVPCPSFPPGLPREFFSPRHWLGGFGGTVVPPDQLGEAELLCVQEEGKFWPVWGKIMARLPTSGHGGLG